MKTTRQKFTRFRVRSFPSSRYTFNGLTTAAVETTTKSFNVPLYSSHRSRDYDKVRFVEYPKSNNKQRILMFGL